MIVLITPQKWFSLCPFTSNPPEKSVTFCEGHPGMCIQKPAASLHEQHTENEPSENQVLTAKVILPKISSGITSSNTLYTYL